MCVCACVFLHYVCLHVPEYQLHSFCIAAILAVHVSHTPVCSTAATQPYIINVLAIDVCVC